VSVTARDPYGNTATGYTGTIHFTSSDPSAILPANYAFVSADSGLHTFSATLKSLGSQTITVTDTVTSSITGSASLSVAPAAPSNLTAIAVSASQINLAWTDNSNGETGYKVERSTDGVHFTTIADLAANSTSFKDTGLKRNTKYYYRVRAYYRNPDLSLLFSDYSLVINATTKKK